MKGACAGSGLAAGAAAFHLTRGPGEPLAAHGPEQPRLVRVSKFEGFWQMRPVGEGQVEVIYQAHTEPGGSLPAWLANSFVVDVPLHTLLALRRLVEPH